jgi:hypothetical protein
MKKPGAGLAGISSTDLVASPIPRTSMISSRDLLLLFTIAGSFFIGVFGASADLGQILPDLHYPRNEALKISGDESMAARYNNNDSQVGNAAEEAINPPIPRSPANSFTRLTLVRHQSVTLTGAPGETVTLKLGHFVLSGNSTFTLQGTATTTFIIKVKNQFSLTGNAKVVLLGGVQWDNVIFVVRGKGDLVSLSRNASLQGILMANKRKVRLRNHSMVNGQVIARGVALRGLSQIDQPPIVSP